MKRWSIIPLFALLAAGLKASDVVLAYEAFGPQSVAHEFIGTEWWQWEPHGDDRPRDYPIQVVVYWDQSLSQTKKKYPVDRLKEQDYRYVRYPSAIAYLAKAIQRVRAVGLDASRLENTLTRLQVEKKGPPPTPHSFGPRL